MESLSDDNKFKMNLQFQDELEALTGVNNHLAYIDTLLLNHEVSKKSRQAINQQIDVLHERLNDQTLYLAIVGEAATGKSTFINALMGEALLETEAAIMTTKTATQVKFFDQTAVSISYQSNGKSVHLDLLTQAHEPITISNLPNIRDLQLRDLIRVCTTDETVVNYLDTFTLYHPSTFLQNGICIIDTPGADATDESHSAVTRHAVAFSDVAIIIIPAKQIVSNSLIKIIQRDLDLMSFLHRCVFLVTGMDMIRARERDKLLKSVDIRLKQKLNVEKLPPIFSISAQSVVDNFSDDVLVVKNSDDRRHWQRQFEETKDALFTHLKKQRALAISEKMLRLVEDLFYALEFQLNQLWQQYEEERQALEAAIIPDLEGFAKQQARECEESMEPLVAEAIRQVELTFIRQRDGLISKIKKDVEDADSLDELKAYVGAKLPNSVSEHQKKLQEDIEPHFNTLHEATKKVSQAFDQRFSEAYRKLAVLQKSDHRKKSGLGLNNKSETLKGVAQQSLDSFELKTFGRQTTGAIIGGVIGAIVLPGIGWIFTAWIGKKLADWFGPSLNERKAELLSELRSSIVNQFDEAQLSVKQTVYEYSDEAQTAVQNRIINHVKQYGQTVAKMQKSQQDEAKHLKKRQILLEQDLNELKRRREVITAQLNTLKSS